MRLKGNILITGGCGFIGSCFIKYVLCKYDDIKIINLDNLTYAGNVNNLQRCHNPCFTLDPDVCLGLRCTVCYLRMQCPHVTNWLVWVGEDLEGWLSSR